MPIKKLKLSVIKTDQGTDVRDKIGDDVIAEYAEAYKAKKKMPPLTVFDCGKDGFILADGFHRYFALDKNSTKDAECDVIKGTRQDAIKHALGANITHGLRRTNADKHKAVEIGLREFPKMSNGALADMCGVSHTFVSEVRTSQVATVATSNDVSATKPRVVTYEPEERQGKDGKTYSIPPRPTKAAPEPEPEKVMDATGIQVPPEIIEHWEASIVEVQNFLTKVSEIRTRIKFAHEKSVPMYRECDHQDILAKLDQVYVDLKRAKPYAVCPECQGIEPFTEDTIVNEKGVRVKQMIPCSSCRGNGWVSSFFWEHMVPEEKKTVTGRK